jgi:hypothetical protein
VLLKHEFQIRIRDRRSSNWSTRYAAHVTVNAVECILVALHQRSNQ